MLLNNKKLKYTFFRLPRRKSVTFYQQRKTGKTRKKGVKTRCGGFTLFFMIIWAFRRGEGGNASKRRKRARPSTYPINAIYTRRAVGLSATMIHHSAQRAALSGTSFRQRHAITLSAPTTMGIGESFPLPSLTRFRPESIDNPQYPPPLDLFSSTDCPQA